MIRAWLTRKFIQVTDRAHASFSRFIEGVMDEIHTLDLKDPDHQLWHPDCPNTNAKQSYNDGSQAPAWFPEVSATDNGWNSTIEGTHE